MAAYDFGGGRDSSFSNFSQAHLAGGVADAGNRSDGTACGGNRSGKAAGSAASSDSGVSLKTVGFILLILFLLYLQIRFY